MHTRIHTRALVNITKSLQRGAQTLRMTVDFLVVGILAVQQIVFLTNKMARGIWHTYNLHIICSCLRLTRLCAAAHIQTQLARYLLVCVCVLFFLCVLYLHNCFVTLEKIVLPATITCRNNTITKCALCGFAARRRVFVLLRAATSRNQSGSGTFKCCAAMLNICARNYALTCVAATILILLCELG